MPPIKKEKMNPRQGSGYKEYDFFLSETLLAFMKQLVETKEKTQDEFAKALNKSQPVVSEQLNVLFEKKLLSFRKEGKTKYYSLNAQGIFETLLAFLEDNHTIMLVYPDLQDFCEKKENGELVTTELFYDAKKRYVENNDVFQKAKKTILTNQKFRDIFLDMFKKTLKRHDIQTLKNAFMFTMMAFCRIMTYENAEQYGVTLKDLNSPNSIVSVHGIFGWYCDLTGYNTRPPHIIPKN